MKKHSAKFFKRLSVCIAVVIALGAFSACGKTDLSVSVTGAENGVITTVYNGSPVSVKANGAEVTLKYEYKGIEGTDYAVSTTAPTNAGNYEVTVSFDGNDTYNPYSATVKLVINKANNNFTVSMADYVYGETASEPNVTGNKGGAATFAYVGTGDTEYASSANAPTDAGSYKVTATVGESANYLAGSAEATFTVSRADNVLEITMADYEVGQTDVEPVVVKNTSGAEVTYVYEGTGNTEYAKSSAKPTEAGDYIVTAMTAETKNYKTATANATFKVEMAKRTDVPENKPQLKAGVMVLDDSFSIEVEADTEYCLTDADGKVLTEYQTTAEFNGLKSNTTYYVQSRRPAKADAAASDPCAQKLEVKTLTSALLDDFERKAAGDGAGNFAVSNAKAHSGKNSLMSGTPDGAYGFIIQPNALIERDDNGNKYNGYWQSGDYDQNYIDISGYKYISFWAWFDKDVAIGQGIEMWKNPDGDVFNCGVGQAVKGGSWQRVVIDLSVNGVVRGSVDDICTHVAKIYFNFAWTPASEIGTFYIDDLMMLK